jgi:4-oxalocrotonate tautomerase
MPEVIVHAAVGRTPEQKKKLMLATTDAMVKEFGAPKEAVTVTIVESPKELKMKAGVLFSER